MFGCEQRPLPNNERVDADGAETRRHEDEEGRPLNANLLDYRMPTSADVPAIETILIEQPGGDGPYGAKGVGEPPIIPPAAAIANAIADATGARHTQLPLTPERVWQQSVN